MVHCMISLTLRCVTRVLHLQSSCQSSLLPLKIGAFCVGDTFSCCRASSSWELSLSTGIEFSLCDSRNGIANRSHVCALTTRCRVLSSAPVRSSADQKKAYRTSQTFQFVCDSRRTPRDCRQRAYSTKRADKYQFILILGIVPTMYNAPQTAAHHATDCTICDTKIYRGRKSWCATSLNRGRSIAHDRLSSTERQELGKTIYLTYYTRTMMRTHRSYDKKLQA
jgi:hypothetical protein